MKKKKLSFYIEVETKSEKKDYTLRYSPNERSTDREIWLESHDDHVAVTAITYYSGINFVDTDISGTLKENSDINEGGKRKSLD
ncbi:hypothetical protein DZB84_04645 [Bacillus sp. HNG]|uniref:hypothetical protein n=1 Tax=Bacillus sp. HNG TaxID=2293325 RepID=UPI000E2F5266|nr:hypothetical protein [Bacillus sp. HNG]RFB18207.1 hypothetical protein DZB84_04645 [Bacillus sp. HNG]